MKTLVLIVLAASASAASANDVRTWDFEVLLDNSTIGSHRFEVAELDNGYRVKSDASFDVRFLFVTAFRYRHSNTEIWQGDCLREFRSETRVNRRELAVSGRKVGGELVVDDGDQQNELEACVMSFAYWNPDFLEQDRLLNPQDGRYLDVSVDELPRQTIQVRGNDVEARVFQLRADKIEVTLWYSDDNEWLALESVARGDRVLRYKLT